MKHSITALEPGEDSFVYNSWLKSFREAKQNRDLPRGVYYRSQGALVGTLLKAHGAKVVVARSVYEPEFIYGYAVGCGDSLHYVYVKSNWRRQGIATALLEALGELKTFTHAREPGAGWLRRLGLEYDGRLFGGRTQAL